MTLMPGLVLGVLLAAAALAFGLVHPFATVHPTIIVAVGTAALAMTLVLAGLMLSVLALLVLALLVMLGRLVLGMVLVLRWGRLGGSWESERKRDRGSDDLHEMSPLDFE